MKNFEEMMKAIGERMNAMQDQITKSMEAKAKEVEYINNQIEEIQNLMKANKAQIDDIENQIVLMNMCKKQLLEQKKGLLAENEDKAMELNELIEKRDKDKFGKYMSDIAINTIIPNDEEVQRENE